MRVIDWLALFGLALMWGISFLLMELAIPSFEPFTMVLIRVGIAAALMLWLIRKRAPWQIIRARWHLYALLGFFGSAFPFLCFAWGQRYIESGLASVLNALTPLFVLVFALLLRWERYNFIRVFGIFLGFAGVAVLMDPDASASEWRGIAAATVAAVSYAIATTTAWAHVSNFSPRENAAGQLFFASLYTLPFALLEQPWNADITLVSVVAVLVLAVCSTFLAYLLYYYLLSNAGGVNAMLAVLLIPVVAVTLGIVILGERFGSNFFVGGALVIVGVFLTDEKLRRLPRTLLSRRTR